MLKKFFLILAVALMMFSCGSEARKLKRNSMQNAMTGVFSRGVGQSCGLVQRCDSGLKCEDGYCVYKYYPQDANGMFLPQPA